MVGLDIAFRIAPGNLEEFRQTALELSGASPLPPGAILIQAHRSIRDPGRFVWIERWKDRASLERRRRSHELSVLIGAIGVLGSLERIDRVEIRRETMNETALTGPHDLWFDAESRTEEGES